MSRIPAVDPASAQGKIKDMLAAVNKSLGITPNLFRVTAQSATALEGLLGLNGALAGGALGPKTREAIALAVSQANSCDYCLSAHTMLGKGAGLTDTDIMLARQGSAKDAKTAAIVEFARSLVNSRGNATEAEVAALRKAGQGNGEIVEVIANVVLDIFTNYVNKVAATDIDFPVVRASERAAA